jgi:multidrug transporter EmrE-like cation transporter
MNHIYIVLTILFTVYGQLVIKWQVSLAGELPTDGVAKLYFLSKLLLNPWIFSGFISAFLAALSWMAAMTKFQLSYAYPYMGIVFAFMLLFSSILFHEDITWTKIVGTTLVVLGVVVVSQG